MSVIGLFKKYLPILDWLPNYSKSNLSGDLSAGITVGIMLIPQGMAYAMLAGLDPIHGLYAVTVPLLLYAIFGSSRHLAVGPGAMVSLLTAASIGALNPSSPEDYLLFTLTLAFLVGLIQFGMGVLRFGFLVNFLSHPVIKGFTSAAAIIIGLNQIKHIFRINLPNSEYIHELVVNILSEINEVHWVTFALGVLGIIIIKYGKKIHRSFPSSIVAVIIGILLVWGLNLTTSHVIILGEVPSGFPEISTPSFDLSKWILLLPVAFAISMVGFSESYAVAKTIQGKHKDYKLDANQELIGLGMANLGAAFFQGYPVTGGFSRTAVNSQSGAKTALASLFSLALIILTLLFFTGLFYYLPNAILAAVILVAVSSLIDYKTPIQLWKKDKVDFFMLMITFVVTGTLGIEIGIVSGMVLSLFVVIYRASNPHIAVLAKVPGTNYFRNTSRFENLEERNDVLMVRIDGPIYFANLNYIKKKLDKWMDAKNELTSIILNFESIPSVDSSGAYELEDWISDWKSKGINVYITGVRGPVRDILFKWNIIKEIGEGHLFADDTTAIDFIDQKIDQHQIQKITPYIRQTSDKK